MCGVFGASKLTLATRKMLPILGLEMESRGRDSWGMSDGREVIKHLGAISDSWEEPPEAWEGVIVHTRSASMGSAKNLENAHPFRFQKEDGSEVIGIHNGAIWNHAELNKQYNRGFDCDSMHIWKHRAEGRGWKEIEGYGALAWWEGGELEFLRWGTYDLHMVTLGGGELVFCSLPGVLTKAAKMLGGGVSVDWKVEEFHRYVVGWKEGKGDVLVDLGVEEFKKKTPPVVQVVPNVSGTRSYSTGTSVRDFRSGWVNKCFMCNRQEVDRKVKLLCEKCLECSLSLWKMGESQVI